jgi:hypothetical protein
MCLLQMSAAVMNATAELTAELEIPQLDSVMIPKR